MTAAPNGSRMPGGGCVLGVNMGRSGFLRAGGLFAALMMAAPVSAGDRPGHIVEGQSAQALRCAAYIVMAGQYGFADGRLTAGDRAVMARWSAKVLGENLGVEPATRLHAYGAALGELGSESQTRALIARHGEWCLRAFTHGTL